MKVQPSGDVSHLKHVAEAPQKMVVADLLSLAKRPSSKLDLTKEGQDFAALAVHMGISNGKNLPALVGLFRKFLI